MREPLPEGRPTPVHRAIDQVTILKLTVRALAHRLEAGVPIDPVDLARMMTALDQVTDVLRAWRDREQADGDIDDGI